MNAIIASVLIFLTAAVIGGSIIVMQNMQAVTPADPELCDPWKMAGGVMLYRCEDDSTGVVCYANGFGFIACTE